jgi:hypothetical protein
VVEYITEDGLFSIDLALRPPPGQEQTVQPAAPAVDAQAHFDGSTYSSDVGRSGGSADAVAELAADGAQEGQVRTCDNDNTTKVHVSQIMATLLSTSESQDSLPVNNYTSTPSGNIIVST